MSTEEKYILQEAKKVLHKGGIIIFPTDTLWGVGCDATQTKAVNRIYKLKKRSLQKGFVLITDNYEQLKKQHPTIIDDMFLAKMKKQTSPTTIVYPHFTFCCDEVKGIDGSVAVRVVEDSTLFCFSLLQILQSPMVATSANIANQASPLRFSDIDQDILDGVDFIVPPTMDSCKKIQYASTIYKIDVQTKTWIQIR